MMKHVLVAVVTASVSAFFGGRRRRYDLCPAKLSVRMQSSVPLPDGLQVLSRSDTEFSIEVLELQYVEMLDAPYRDGVRSPHFPDSTPTLRGKEDGDGQIQINWSFYPSARSLHPLQLQRYRAGCDRADSFDPPRLQRRGGN
jgi:hypothetical protein